MLINYPGNAPVGRGALLSRVSVVPSPVGLHLDTFSIIIIIISVTMFTIRIVTMIITITISILTISRHFGFSVYRTVNRSTCAQAWGSQLRWRRASGHPNLTRCMPISSTRGAESLWSPTP